MSEKLTIRIPVDPEESKRPGVPRVVSINQARLNERSKKHKRPRIVLHED